jgi:two-component system response regulator MprA
MQTSEQRSEQQLPPRRRVLIVEDTEPTRRRMSATLSAHGYDIVEASDGLKALKAVSAQRFDAILLDLVMPNVDGWQFRETQLRHPELAAIPTVIVTVQPLREPERYALRTPNIIRKPFEDDELVAIVNRACAAQPLPAPRRPESSEGSAVSSLFWSRRGEIACAVHAPAADSERWTQEQWTAIPPNPGYQQIVYQCQYCPGHQGPIQRRPRH